MVNERHGFGQATALIELDIDYRKIFRNEREICQRLQAFIRRHWYGGLLEAIYPIFSTERKGLLDETHLSSFKHGPEPVQLLGCETLVGIDSQQNLGTRLADCNNPIRIERLTSQLELERPRSNKAARCLGHGVRRIGSTGK